MKGMLQSLKAAVRSVVRRMRSRVKRLFKPTQQKAKAASAVRNAAKSLLDVKPKNGKDYVSFFAWLVSKPLARLAVLIVGIFSLYYLIFINPPSVFAGKGGIRTYSYNSIPLKFAKGNVRIKARSGYAAYEGNVEKGFVTGKGTLYGKSGGIVYTGDFKKNQYNGEGKLYYPGGQMKYEGNFENNDYSGEGTLYRENGSKEYTGGFSKGMKNGEGKLFDSGDNEIFTGNFSQDELLYSDLLGKTTEEINQVYTGERKLYTDGGDGFAAALEDIDAVYSGAQDGAALDDSMKVEGIYILKDQIYLKDRLCKSVPDLKKTIGEPEYEGNSSVTLPEAVAISYLNEKKNSLFGPVNMDSAKEFSDVITVNDFDPDYLVYLYSYTIDGIRYTFFCSEKDGEFAMYQIEKE